MLKTWDIFDTLIARRYVQPVTIFQIVEQTAGHVPGFVKLRNEAEKNLILRGEKYNLDDIYDELQKISGASKEVCDKLKNLECDTEIENAIPIRENLLQVKAGDVLISDMYLPEKIIRKILNKVGLRVPVEIVITNHGKSSGQIWKQIADQNKFVFHIGDNAKSDFKNPRLAGFESSITLLSAPNEIEKFLFGQDIMFAGCLREIRLLNPYREEVKRLYWNLFSLNAGILILTARKIDELQKKYGFEYLGFCGRDTYYLRQIYEKYKADLNEEPPANDYLHYSRKLITGSKDAVAEYYADKISGRKALLIDLSGSGTHLHELREEKNFDYSILICGKLDSYSTKTIYKDKKTFPEKWISFLENPEKVSGDKLNFYFTETMDGDTQLWSMYCELFNRATHNSPIRSDTVKIGEKIIPEVTFSEVNDTENLDVFLACMEEILRMKINWGAGITDEKFLPVYKKMLATLTEQARGKSFSFRHAIDSYMDLKLSEATN